MKTILYMSLTADGYFRQSDERQGIPPEILGNFVQIVGKTGNLINGRRTFDLLQSRMAQGGFSGIELVVLSRTPAQIEGICFATSPQEALQYLEQEGFETALIGGGAQIDSAFLSQGLVDEIYLNVEPVLANKGIRLAMPDGFEANLQLIGTAQLSENIVQLHYSTAK